MEKRKQADDGLDDGSGIVKVRHGAPYVKSAGPGQIRMNENSHQVNCTSCRWYTPGQSGADIGACAPPLPPWAVDQLQVSRCLVLATEARDCPAYREAS